MKIYTKTGDKGETGLIGGNRVSKAHLRINAYGSVDELNAHLGLVRDHLPERKVLLASIQERLFEIGSQLANDPAKPSPYPLPEITQKDIDVLEVEMDKMDAILPPLKNFVLPGGHPTVSHIHITRTVCRRAERYCVELKDAEGQAPHLVVEYLNRLSDFFFVLSRAVSQKLGAEETPWTPRK
jgi:cob(I)alamin adenosyltransferase